MQLADKHSPIVKLQPEIGDMRGHIQPLVDEGMKSAVMIFSKAGTVRANHYHRTDWHFCLLLRGEIDYYFRPVGDKGKPNHCRIAQGQMFFTPPMMEHAMVFHTESEFLCLGRNPRDQVSYENDIVRVQVYPFE